MSVDWLMSGSVELHIDASPDDVYAHIVDVTRAAQRSDEVRSCEWLPGAPPGTVGSRFRGRNKRGVARWSRVCEVLVADEDRAFAFRTVPERIDLSRSDSTTWRYDLSPDGAGTLVTHSYEITKMPVQPFKWIYARVFPHHRDNRAAMRTTLERLRSELEGGPSANSG